MLFKVINHLSVKFFHLLMIKRSLLNEIQGVRYRQLMRWKVTCSK